MRLLARRLAWAGLGLALVIAGIAVAVPYVAGPTARRLAEERLAAATGRPWRVAGSPGLSLTPDLAVVVRDLRAETTLETGPLTVRAAALRLAGSPGALLDGRVERIDVDRPVLELPASWWRDGVPGNAAAGAARPEGRGLDVRRVVVRDASLAIRTDLGRRTLVEGVDLDLAGNLAGTPGGGALAAKLVLGGDGSATVDATLGPADPGRGGARPLTMTAAAPRWLAAPVTATADAAWDGGLLVLSRLAGALGAQRFEGAFALDALAKPRARLDLAFADLAFADLTVPGEPARDAAGWRIDPADFALLKEFDLRATLLARRLSLPGGAAPLADVAGEVELADGVVAIRLQRAAVYGGAATASLTLTPAGADLAHALEARVTDVRGLPLLTDLAGFTLLDGRASARLALRSTGWSGAEALRNAAGEAELDVRDGRLDTVDLPALPGLVMRQLPSVTQRRDADTTAFDRVAARFRIKDGRAASDDLVLESLLVTATGVGAIDLVSRTLELRIDSRLLAKGGLVQGLDVTVPVIVEGPLAAPQVRPDLRGARITSGPNGLPGLDALGSALGKDGGPGRDAPGADILGKGLGGLLDALIPRAQPRP